MLPATECAVLPDLPIPAHARIARPEKPVFFGHYWLTGVPVLQTARHVCVDYSAGKGGRLVAFSDVDAFADSDSLLGTVDE